MWPEVEKSALIQGAHSWLLKPSYLVPIATPIMGAVAVGIIIWYLSARLFWSWGGVGLTEPILMRQTCPGCQGDSYDTFTVHLVNAYFALYVFLTLMLPFNVHIWRVSERDWLFIYLFKLKYVNCADWQQFFLHTLICLEGIVTYFSLV